jgi:hypothetical protein
MKNVTQVIFEESLERCLNEGDVYAFADWLSIKWFYMEE